MLNYRDYGNLLQIIKHCQRIVDKTNNIKFDDIVVNEDIKEILCFNLLQIGELAKKLSNEFINTYNDIPWKQIKGMRDRVVHSYGTINFSLIYNTAIIDIPKLLEYCTTILISSSS